MPDGPTPELWELSRQIRDYGHNPRRRERLYSVRFDWHQWWTALDIIDDVDLAIKAYFEADFPSTHGEQHFRVFGIFQVLFEQLTQPPKTGPLNPMLYPSIRSRFATRLGRDWDIHFTNMSFRDADSDANLSLRDNNLRDSAKGFS
jgi:hypothetical protein